MQQRDNFLPSPSSSSSSSSSLFSSSPDTPSSHLQDFDLGDVDWTSEFSVQTSDTTDLDNLEAAYHQFQRSHAQAHLAQQHQSPSSIHLNNSHVSPSSAQLLISQPHHHLIQPYVVQGSSAPLHHQQQQKQFESHSDLHHQVTSSLSTSFSTSSESSGPQAFDRGKDKYEQHQQQQQQHQQRHQLPYPLQPSHVVAAPRASTSSSTKSKAPSKVTPATNPGPIAHPYLQPPSNSQTKHPVEKPSRKQEPSRETELASVDLAGYLNWLQDSHEKQLARSSVVHQPHRPRVPSPLSSFSPITPFSSSSSFSSSPSSSSSSTSPPSSVASDSPPAQHARAPLPGINFVLKDFIAANLIAARPIPATISLSHLFNTFYFASPAELATGTVMNSLLQELDENGNKTGYVFVASDLWWFFREQGDVGRQMEFLMELVKRGERWQQWVV